MSLTPPAGKKQILIAVIISIVAIIAVIAIIKMSDSPAPSVIEGDYESYRKRAEYYFDTKKYRKAERDYLHGINLLKNTKPTNDIEKQYQNNLLSVYYHFSLGALYDAQEDNDKWIAALNDALFYLEATTPQDTTNLVDIGFSLFYKVLIYEDLAFIYDSQKNDYKQAFAYYDKALAIRNPHVRLESIYVKRAKLKIRQEDWQGAENDYAQAIKLSPNDSSIYANRGLDLYYKRGNYQSALIDCEIALKLEPLPQRPLKNLNSDELKTFQFKDIYQLCIKTKKKLGLEKEAMAHIKDATALGFKNAKIWGEEE